MLLASTIYTTSLTTRLNRSRRSLKQAKAHPLTKGYAAQGSATN